MKIILDLRESPSENDIANLAALSECSRPQTVRDYSQDEGTNEENPHLSKPHHAWYPAPSQTPIYDFEMRAAGKELGSEKKILKEGLPKRCFGGQKRLLQNFMGATRELRQDIDRAWGMMLDEELCGVIQYGRFCEEAGRRDKIFQGTELGEMHEMGRGDDLEKLDGMVL